MKKKNINKISISYFKKYVKVYLEDTDAGGIVYHASYLKFCERARTDMLNKMNIKHDKLIKNHGLKFVVHKMNIEYLKFATLEQVLTVKTYITMITAVKIHMRQTISLNTEPIVKVNLALVCLNLQNKATRIPDNIFKKFKQKIYREELVNGF